MELADGRRLAWAEAGDPDGYPVFLFHGTPGSHHQVMVDEQPFVDAGVRLIAPDRPGYGQSTYQRHRTLKGWAGDVGALADRLELGSFGVMGISGGGPHSAACARFLPQRVSAAALLSGVAPMVESGSEAGMMRPNRFFARAARRAPMVNAVPFGLLAVMGRRQPDRALAMVVKNAPKPDRAAFDDPLVREAFRRDMAEASKTTGRAAAQDFGLITRDWGFHLADITVPVHVWHADADVNVPLAHAELQAAAIPGATLHMVPGEGHLMCVAHMPDILAALLGK